MRFTKIKRTTDGVELSWVEKKEGGALVDSHLVAPETPLPEFALAFSNFREYVIDLLELPEKWAELITVTSLTLDDTKDGRRSLMVSATKTLQNSNRPLVLNTPLMVQRGDNTSDSAIGILDEQDLKLIAEADRVAEAYMRGAREQLDVFRDADEETKTSENTKEFAERSAAAESATTRKPRKPKSGPSFIPGVGEVQNPNAGPPPNDEQLRNILLAAKRDVPVDAIGRWTSSERATAATWAENELAPALDKVRGKIAEPECVLKDATPYLLDNHIASEEAKGDGWTSEPPPKLDDAVVGEITQASKGIEA